MSNKTYAGIGSRNTPPDLLIKMSKIANALANDNYVLHSGGAGGADSAFELWATAKKIYLPWSGFNGKYIDNKTYFVPESTNYATELVMDYHPHPDKLSPAAFKLMIRNCYQVLGDDLNSPVNMVICWTTDGKASGGTGQALRIAEAYAIPIYNLFWPEDVEKLTNDFQISLA